MRGGVPCLGLSGYPDGVDENRGPWHEGQQAWSRLEGWYQDALLPGVAARAGDAGDGLRALRALEDSGLVRRLLDQVEFEAVRAARRDGRSWAEIAVKLGVARQSAWERWKDVDESASASASADGQPGERGSGYEAGQGSEDVALEVAVDEAARELLEASKIPERMAREWRRRSTVKVPNLIGTSVDVARKLLREKGLVAASPDPDGPPLGALDWSDGVVLDQSPEAGAKVPPGWVVRLWVERGGGGSGGVREPRRPLPDPGSGHRMRDEVSGESVG